MFEVLAILLGGFTAAIVAGFVYVVRIKPKEEPLLKWIYKVFALKLLAIPKDITGSQWLYNVAHRLLADNRAETDIISWVIGVIIAAILGVGVAIPIVVDTVNTVLPNVSGITATVLGVIPVAIAITLLLTFLGR